MTGSLLSRVLCAVLCGCLTSCSGKTEDCGQLPADTSVGNAGCVVMQGDALAMVQQRRDDSWSIPGGTEESGERAACTAARETHEETGLQVRPLKLLRVLDNGFHVYWCAAEGSTQLKPIDWLEIKGAAWKRLPERDQLTWRFPAEKPLLEALIKTLPVSPPQP